MRLVKLGGFALALGVGALAVIEWWPVAATIDPDQPIELTGDPNRGAYLHRMSGCIACHSDFENGGSILAGGKALDTPYGSFVPPNITPDPEAGLGAWAFGDFVAAMRQGVSPAGEPYYPAFPFTFYTKLSDQDLADLWAAIQTVPAVAEPAPAHDLMPPFNWRSAMKIWQALFFKPGRIEPVVEQSAAWNRGAYIVEGAAHCGACHSQRNLLGAIDADMALQGSDNLPGGGKAPAITQAALDDAGWTRRDIVWALKTGNMPDGDTFGGSMGEVVRDGTQFLSDDDLIAIATYLLPDAED